MSDSPHFPLLKGVVFPVLGNSQASTRDVSSTGLESGEGGEGKSFNSELKATKATLILILFSSQTVLWQDYPRDLVEAAPTFPDTTTRARASRLKHVFEISTHYLVLVMDILGLPLQAWS